MFDLASSRLKPVPQCVRGAFSGTGFSREEASSGATFLLIAPPSLWSLLANALLIVPTLCVGMQPRRSASSGGRDDKAATQDAERPGRHSHAERGNDHTSKYRVFELASSRLKPVPQCVRGASSGTGFSREEASSGATFLLIAPPSLWERACSRMLCAKQQIFHGCTGPFVSKLIPTGFASPTGLVLLPLLPGV